MFEGCKVRHNLPYAAATLLKGFEKSVITILLEKVYPLILREPVRCLTFFKTGWNYKYCSIRLFASNIKSKLYLTLDVT